MTFFLSAYFQVVSKGHFKVSSSLFKRAFCIHTLGFLWQFQHKFQVSSCCLTTTQVMISCLFEGVTPRSVFIQICNWLHRTPICTVWLWLTNPLFTRFTGQLPSLRIFVISFLSAYNVTVSDSSEGSAGQLSLLAQILLSVTNILSPAFCQLHMWHSASSTQRPQRWVWHPFCFTSLQLDFQPQGSCPWHNLFSVTGFKLQMWHIFNRVWIA